MTRANVSSADYRALVARQATQAAPAAKRPAPTRKERDIQRAILDAARYWKGVTLWRCNSGAVKDGTRFIRFGAVGMSDLIGWRAEVTREKLAHHGLLSVHGEVRTARFVALEIKRPGKFPTREQQAFLDAVNAAGGIGVVARSVEDARRALQP